MYTISTVISPLRALALFPSNAALSPLPPMVGTRGKPSARTSSTPVSSKRPANALNDEPTTRPIKKTMAALTPREAPPSTAKSNPKFKPRPISKKIIPKPLVDGHVPRGSSILIIQRPWIDLILDGYKTLEIRGKACTTKVGKRVYLALSGGGGIVLGSVDFVACHGPLSRAEWAARGDEHCVGGDALPYGASTHAWEFQRPKKFKEPVPYVTRQGCVVWAIKE